MSLILSKVLSQLMLPPGSLIITALVGLMFSRRLWGRLLILLSLLLLWLLSTEPVRDALLAPLENRYPPLVQIAEDAGAIVLLGGGIYEHAPEYGGANALSGFAMMRTLYAADLAGKSGLPVYASGGLSLAGGGDESEAEVMRRWLIRLGVDASRVRAESSARTTWENASYIQAMLARQGIRKVVLVTTAWHMPRSVAVFEAAGLSVQAAPCDYKVEDEPYDLRSYLPRWNVFSDSCDGLHEYLGRLWYGLKRLIQG